jgi:hypothetical protein
VTPLMRDGRYPKLAAVLAGVAFLGVALARTGAAC